LIDIGIVRRLYLLTEIYSFYKNYQN